MVLKSLSSGFSTALGHKRMVLIFYLANLIAGLIIMIPFRSLVSSLVGYSLMGKELAGGLNMDFIPELLIKSATAFDTATALLLLFPFLYWLWNLFLSGGAYGSFIYGTGEGTQTFWGYSAKYFGRLFRLFLWSIPVIIVLYLTQFVVTLTKTLIWGADAYQYIDFWASWIRVGWGYIAIIFYYLIFDYARIILITNDEQRTRRALWQGIRFTFKHLMKTFALSILIFIFSQIFLLAYIMIAPLFGTATTFMVILLLLIQQLYILVRMTLRLTLYSAQVNLYSTIESREDAEPSAEFQPVSVA
jgi:hypothetical protein